MIKDAFNISVLQDDDRIPDQSELPGNKYLVEAPLGDWIRDALEVTDEESAKSRLLDITAVYLWRNVGVLSWRAAVAQARDAIAWIAFAKDVSKGNAFTGKTDPASGHTTLLYRIENTTWREIAFNWYGAKIQLRDRQSAPEVSEARMNALGNRIRRNRSSKAQKEAEPATAQPSLF